jgi:hypothetical protein
MALTGVSGALASVDLLDELAGGHGGGAALRAVLSAARRTLGPASSARHVYDALAAPLLGALDLDAAVVSDGAGAIVVSVDAGGRRVATASIGGWNADLSRLRRSAARVPDAPRWWLGANGPLLRILDAARACSRRWLDLDLESVEGDDRALRALHALFDRGGAPSLGALESIVERTERHRAAVGVSLQAGVEEALPRLVTGLARGRRRPPHALDAAMGDALTMVYRILFLLFAEARGLVPHWHPVYRDSYTIESLRPIAEGGGSASGLWQSLQAIARLAHRGCTAGSLRVVPFNGRLFAPSAAPLADAASIDDGLARDVLLAVTTRPGRDRRDRISYADLGVEQLGAVYERVLDYEPAIDNGRVTLARSGRRKSTGTFYTPRSMTEYLVRRTLAPLVRGRSPEGVLALRVVDPAMGSGAFLVAACRYLADAYEEALVSEGTLARSDVTPADRAAFRRAVAQRCLYGVDLNPTAVQLARLSLWLCTLAADRPLTFFDHHLRAGNSLIGARLHDLARQRPGRGRGAAPLPLFEDDDLPSRVAHAVAPRLRLESVPDDTAAIVKSKERAIEALDAADGPLGGSRLLADAWCAAWFWPGGAAAMTPRAWPALAAFLRGAGDGLPPGAGERWRAAAAETAARMRFFHWEVEFPEVFFDESGAPKPRAGFDAAIGNPPWAPAHALTAFTRESGCFTLQGSGHANLYQLFAERMLRLTAPGGRVGMLMPSGLLADHGCAALRRHLFERCEVDAAVGFDNRKGLFPIHRGVRFWLVTATAGGATTSLQTRCRLRAADVLDDAPDEGTIPGAVHLPLSLVRRFGGDALSVPEVEHERDRAILARILANAPALGSGEAWGARFGRELNATDDRRHFGAKGLPILEGKLIDPFVARVSDAAAFISPALARRALGHRARFDRPRLGYREVAASTNRLTLIAAIVPAGVVTTHTIFCMREPDDEELRYFLCGVFNSFAANYLVRLRGGTHVPASVIHQLPVPAPARSSEAFAAIARLAREACDETRGAARAELQARVARAYGLDAGAFAHVLGTFPLAPREQKAAALDAFDALVDAI